MTTFEIKPHFSNDDLGNGLRFKYLHGEKARFCKAWEKWLIWNGKRWEVDEGAIALALAEETTGHVIKEIHYWRGLAQSEKNDAKKEAILVLVKTLEKHARYSSFKGGLQNMLWNAGESRLPIKPDLLDTGNWLLNVANGTVNLKTGELMPHSQADLITKLVDIPFDANAKAPRWEKFLDEVMGGDKEMTHYLQKAIGYTLTGDTREQCFFFLYGLGSNGKSLFTSTLEKLLGGSKEYCTRVPAESLMKKGGSNSDGPSPSKAALAGARLVTAAEIEDGCTLDEAFIKDVTGQDEISARFLHHDLFTFKPHFKLWMYGNHKPTIKGTDNGIKRRPRLIPFKQVFEGERVDKDLEAKLVTELPGILAWAIMGCLSWQQEGLTTPTAVAQATQDYFNEMDVIGLFIGACCVIATDSKASAKSLYDAYVQWALGGGEKPMNQRRFGQKLTERGGLTRVKRGTGHWWNGVGLVIDTDMVGEVTHFSESDPLVTHSKEMGHLPETAPHLINYIVSDPSDPFLREITREEKNNVYDVYDVNVYEKEVAENGSLGSLDAYFVSENNGLRSDPSKKNGSPMGHYGSLDGSLDYLHNKLPRGLIRDDRTFIEKCIKSFESNELSSVLDGYIKEYRLAYTSEPNENCKLGSGRSSANTWLRELSERRVSVEYAE